MAVPRYHSGQLSAIAWLRWRIFANALRNTRGKLELTSWILVSVAVAIAGVGGAFGMCLGAYFFLTTGKPQLLALLLWPIFVFWQAFPIMATAFTSTSDASDLLRFPLGYGQYFLVRMAYGVFDPATAIGSLWCLGIALGVGLAKPGLLLWTLLVLLIFGAFNLLFFQMVFAWIERWLAQRRSREIMGVLFVLLMLSFQLIGPITAHLGKRSRPDIQRFIEFLLPVQALLPPGVASDSITQGIYPQWSVALSSLALLCAFALVAGYCLHIRLLAQYRGENLSEVAAASTSPRDRALRLGWKLPGFPTSVAAVFEKEIRYLLRSGPMLLTLVMPISVLVVIRLGPLSSARRPWMSLSHTSDMAFPAAAAYTLLMLTNLVYNNFGGDGAGIQLFYASPVRFREIVLAKNLTHAAILATETFVAWIAVSVLYRPPALAITIATLAGLLFAALVNFSAGNLLSLYSPKKLDYSKFRQQQASQVTVLISLAVQFVVVSVAAAVFWFAGYYGSFWVATILLLALSGVSLAAYIVVLRRVERLAVEKLEILVDELCRA